jgi:hypothetical protein
MSGFSEMQIGKGTLGYKGETQEYYDSKKGLWNKFRWVLTAIFLVLGALFLVAASSPIISATVISVTDQPEKGGNLVGLRTPNGTTASVVIAYTDTPAVKSTVTVMELPGGRIALGDPAETGRAAGFLFLAIGVAIGLFSIWRIRNPKTTVPGVVAPDDTYDISAHSRQGFNTSRNGKDLA